MYQLTKITRQKDTHGHWKIVDKEIKQVDKNFYDNIMNDPDIFSNIKPSRNGNNKTFYRPDGKVKTTYKFK